MKIHKLHPKVCTTYLRNSGKSSQRAIFIPPTLLKALNSDKGIHKFLDPVLESFENMVCNISLIQQGAGFANVNALYQRDCEKQRLRKRKRSVPKRPCEKQR